MPRMAASIVFLACIAVAESNAQEKSPPLPKHVVAKNTSLLPKKGRRIEIHVTDANLTKAQCEQLIARYRKTAAPDGQVSVRKPAKALGGELFPWCVENFDGKGVQFNDIPFK